MRTMLNRSKRLSSSSDLFSMERIWKQCFWKSNIVRNLLILLSRGSMLSKIKPKRNRVMISWQPCYDHFAFKEQKSADSVRRQLSDLGEKIDGVLKPVLASRKFSEVWKSRKESPHGECVVYEFKRDSCDAYYTRGYTSRYLHLRIEKQKNPAIG